MKLKSIQKRERSGKRQRDPIARICGERRAVAEQRCKFMGWQVTPDTVRRALKAHTGTLLGCLNIIGEVKDGAYEGLDSYAATVHRYRTAIGLPSQHISAVEWGAVRGLSDALSDDEAQDRARRATSAYMAAEGAMLSVLGAKDVVYDVLNERIEATTIQEAVAIIGPARMEALNDAGFALMKHFGLTSG